jgi:hypothetical protein
MPALEFLKADYTEVWVPSVVVPLVQFADKAASIAGTGIDTFGISNSDAAFINRLRSFDEVVSWYGANRVEFREAMGAAGVNCAFHAALPPSDSGEHVSDFFSRQVGAPLGQVTKLKVLQAAPRGSVVIHPFSGGARKNWPLEKYRELAARLKRPVEWLAGPEEQLERACRFDDLGALARWLSGASAYVGNDSGITHLAAAVGIPTVALFGPTDPALWCPRGKNARWLRHEPIAELSVEAVESEVTY